MLVLSPAVMGVQKVAASVKVFGTVSVLIGELKGLNVTLEVREVRSVVCLFFLC